MEKIDLTTPDIAQENVEKLATLFPDVVTEVREDDGSLRHTIDVEALKARVGDIAEDKRERYQFTWPGKQKAKAEAVRPIDKTMRPCPEESVNWDTTQNLYIEGDNLDALKLLRNTYAGKIKMIYIDPPYNTGKDFIYKDRCKQSKEDMDTLSSIRDDEGNQLGNRYELNLETNGTFHSDWCSMMYPRLLLAKDLLSEDGVIFISIDDCELQNLMQICNEIFGSDNLLSIICVELSKTQGMKVSAAQNGQIVKNHEYILCLSKQKENATLNRRPLYDRAAPYDSHFDIVLKADGSMISISTFFDSSGYWSNAFLRFGLKNNKDGLAKLLAVDEEARKTFNKTVAPHLFRKSMISLPRIQKLDIPVGKVFEFEGYLLLKNAKGTIEQLQSFGDTIHQSDEYDSELERTTIRGALWKGFFSDMMNVAKEGGVNFKNGKKPVRLIKQIIKWTNRNDAIVLDFFSGSATTAHAVMQLNAEDGGNRKFIMVQLPEPCDEKSEAVKAGYKNICEIGKERIRRAGRKIVEEVGVSNAQLKIGEEPKKVPDIGFRVLKIDSSNFRDVRLECELFSQDTLAGLADNLKSDRSAEDLLFQVMPQFQIPFTASIEKLPVDGKTVYNVDDGLLLACFDQDVSTEVIKQMANMQPSYAVLRDASFVGDDAMANFAEVFKTVSSSTITKVV